MQVITEKMQVIISDRVQSSRNPSIKQLLYHPSGICHTYEAGGDRGDDGGGVEYLKIKICKWLFTCSYDM